MSTFFYGWLPLMYVRVGVYSSVPTARTLIVHNKDRKCNSYMQEKNKNNFKKYFHKVVARLKYYSYLCSIIFKT